MTAISVDMALLGEATSPLASHARAIDPTKDVPMVTTASEMVATAKAAIENLTTDQFAAELDERDVVLVDLREPTETAQGVIPGAVTAPRGMLEFYADPTTPYHLDELAPDRRTVLYCASGGRSALAAQTLEALGYTDVAHLEGGFRAWTGEGRPVDREV